MANKSGVTMGRENAEVFRNLGIQADDYVGKTVMKAGLIIEGAGKKLCPVRHGRLRASIATRMIAKHSVEVGSNVEYAVFVHDGTERQVAQPFLQQAVDNELAEIEQEFYKMFQGGRT